MPDGAPDGGLPPPKSEGTPPPLGLPVLVVPAVVTPNIWNKFPKTELELDEVVEAVVKVVGLVTTTSPVLRVAEVT